jgi:short subunit dehydrogenase-like uncharacterized protein
MSGRPFDVVLYGAAGFTGRQAVAYFARHADSSLRWAIAGRSRARLEAARAAVGGAASGRAILVADSGDQASVDAVVSQASVILSTAGPFALHGTPVVDACVRFGTHYVDITGETPWVRGLITRYHERAAANGTRIITCCGFDSVPSDLGALLMARHIRDRLGVGCVEVRAYFQMYGGFNGGTIASFVNMIDTGALTAAADPFLLDPPIPHRSRQSEGSRDLTTPRHDRDLGAYIGPFFMAFVNERVVRRSAALYAMGGEAYGPDFVYREALKYDPPFARAKAWITTIGIARFNQLLKRPRLRQMIAPLLPQPGTGPSEAIMDKGSFTCELLGFAEDGRRVPGFIRHRGDPGNRATVKFVCEGAMALAGELSALSGGSRYGGVLTPATGLGPMFADRLRRAGVTIDIGQGMTRSPVQKAASRIVVESTGGSS